MREVLRDIGADAVPELLVVNKIDAAAPDDVRILAGDGGVAVSAKTGEGIDKLLAAIGDRLRALATVLELVVPYDRGDVLAALHRDGEVLIEVHAEEGMRVRARLGDAERSRFDEFVAR